LSFEKDLQDGLAELCRTAAGKDETVEPESAEAGFALQMERACFGHFVREVV